MVDGGGFFSWGWGGEAQGGREGGCVKAVI